MTARPLLFALAVLLFATADCPARGVRVDRPRFDEAELSAAVKKRMDEAAEQRRLQGWLDRFQRPLAGLALLAFAALFYPAVYYLIWLLELFSPPESTADGAYIRSGRHRPKVAWHVCMHAVGVLCCSVMGAGFIWLGASGMEDHSLLTRVGIFAFGGLGLVAVPVIGGMVIRDIRAYVLFGTLPK